MEIITAAQAHELSLQANSELFNKIMNDIKEKTTKGESSINYESLPKCIIDELIDMRYTARCMETTTGKTSVLIVWYIINCILLITIC